MGKKVHSAIKPLKKDKRTKKVKHNDNPPGLATFPLPMGHPKPFIKSPQHAKWPALFKRHLGVIENHVRVLDRVMNSMKAEMVELPEDERKKWELGEAGNWRRIVGMMDRTRATLEEAREAARGILPARELREKKNLGSMGINYEPLGPKLEQMAKQEGYQAAASEEESAGSGTEDQDKRQKSEEEAAGAEKFTPLTIGKKRKLEEANEDVDASDASETKVEPNPYFMVDTAPTPVVVDEGAPKKKAKKSKDSEKKFKKAKPKDVEEVGADTIDPATIDLNAIQAQLQAEVEEGLKAKLEADRANAGAEEASSETSSKQGKKRKRVSNGTSVEVVEKKAKKEKTPKKIKDKKRKAESAEEDPGIGSETGKKKRSKSSEAEEL